MLSDRSVWAVTVTVKLQVAVLPLLSRTVQLTVVAPTANVLPLGGTQVTLVTAQLSLLAGVGKVTTAEHTPVLAG